MKKMKLILVSVCLGMFLVSCGKSSQVNPNEIVATEDTAKNFMGNVVNQFYHAGYDYTQIDQYKKADQTTQTIIKGQVFVEPYKEHITVVDAGNAESTYSELYYEEKHNKIKATLISNGKRIEQTAKARQYPDGYGQAVTYTKEKNQKIDGKEMLVYQGEYILDVGRVYQIKDELKANVKQTYYITQKQHKIYKIETDLSDYDKMIAIATDISTNGQSKEEASANIKKDMLKHSRSLEIEHFGDPTPFKEK